MTKENQKKTRLSTVRVDESIDLNPRGWFHSYGVEIPPYVWKDGSFNFPSHDFSYGGGNTRLEVQNVNGLMQAVMFQRFAASSYFDFTYCLSSDIDDQKPLYFAAFIVQSLLERFNNVRVLWKSVNHFVYMNREEYRGFLSSHPVQNVLVLSGLTPDLQPDQMRVLRDLSILYRERIFIPVFAGCVGVEFMLDRAHLPVDLYFHSRDLVVRSPFRG